MSRHLSDELLADITDSLAEVDSATSQEIAAALGISERVSRIGLRMLERLGCATSEQGIRRHARGRNLVTRWRLG